MSKTNKSEMRTPEEKAAEAARLEQWDQVREFLGPRHGQLLYQEWSKTKGQNPQAVLRLLIEEAVAARATSA